MILCQHQKVVLSPTMLHQTLRDSGHFCQPVITACYHTKPSVIRGAVKSLEIIEIAL